MKIDCATTSRCYVTTGCGQVVTSTHHPHHYYHLPYLPRLSFASLSLFVFGTITSSDLQGHSPIAGFFRWDFSYTCAVVDKISTDSASRGPSASAELLVFLFRWINIFYISCIWAKLTLKDSEFSTTQISCFNWSLLVAVSWLRTVLLTNMLAACVSGRYGGMDLLLNTRWIRLCSVTRRFRRGIFAAATLQSIAIRRYKINFSETKYTSRMVHRADV